MPPRVKQAAKILVSGILFSCLVVGGCLCTLLLRPVLATLPGGAEARRRRALRAIRFCFRLFVLGLTRSGILRVETRDLPPPERLPGAIILANHYSYLDIVILIALLPDTVCVVKEGVWNNLFFGPIVRAAGFIPNLDPEEVLERGRKALAAGRTMVIFPAGTRTRPEAACAFRRGAAHLALRSGAPVLPFLITVDPPLLAKGDRWYHVPAETCVFRITWVPWAAPALSQASLTRQARQFTAALEGHFGKALSGVSGDPGTPGTCAAPSGAGCP
jgi:1-acyl-sn-glycerol-3-phosphate acyltransferase